MRSAPGPFSALPDRESWPEPDSSLRTLIPTQTQAWMQARAGLVPGEAIANFSVGDNDKTKAFVPLLQHGGWLRELPRMFEPGDLIWSTSESLYALAGRLARQPRPVQLERVPTSSPSIAALRRAFRGRGIVLTREAMPTPFIDLASTNDPYACLTPRRRSDLRRAERRAQKFGEVQYEIHSPRSEKELMPLIDEVLAVESRSWKVEAGTALTTDTIQGDFFRKFTKAALDDGMLRIAFLRIDGHAVAMQIAAEWRQCFWLFKISHDQEFSACSPGQLLIGHTLSYSARSGLLSYEFMGVMDRWTEHWTKTHRQYLSVYAIPFSTIVFKMLVKRVLGSAYSKLRRFLR